MAEQRIVPRYAVATFVALVAITLGGCGSGRITMDPSGWFGSGSDNRPTSGAEGGFTVTRGSIDQTQVTRAIAASDLVGADGQCQGAASATRVVLAITECELVATAGVPEQVNIGASENGDRRTVLTYSRGDYPGIYTFASGRLRIIEGVAPSRPEPRRRAPKKKSA